MPGIVNKIDNLGGVQSFSSARKEIDQIAAYRQSKELEIERTLENYKKKNRAKLQSSDLLVKMEAERKLAKYKQTLLNKVDSDLAKFEEDKQKMLAEHNKKLGIKNEVDLNKLKEDFAKQLAEKEAAEMLKRYKEEVRQALAVSKIGSDNHQTLVRQNTERANGLMVMQRELNDLMLKGASDAEIQEKKAQIDQQISEMNAFAEEFDARLAYEEKIKQARQQAIATQAKSVAATLNLEESANAKGLKNKLKAQSDLNKEIKKALDTQDKAQRAANANAIKEKLNQQHEAQIDELTAVEELNKTKYQNEAELHKQQILHATALGDHIAANGKSYAENMMGAAKGALDAISGSIDKYLSVYRQYMSGINARIQGAGFDYSDLNKRIRQNTSASGVMRYTAVLENLNKLVEAGIADNLLQRTFLDNISDKIATTFDAAEASLLNIVRIQQQDTTASRLGMEAYLTRMFNHYFSDTSYLSRQFDSVQETLIAVSAQLPANLSVEFEFIVQKWLGSLSSVGVSDSTIAKIAEGISYLGSGNVEALSSDSALQNLMVMASNKAGLSYSDMLIRGMSSQDANKLMYGVVEYVKEIASSSNNVVKSQLAELFGVTIVDMQAFHNLSDTVVNDLYGSAMTYRDTLTELNSQLSQVSKRMHISERMENLLDNTLAGVGMSIADNAGLYMTYKAFDILESFTGGINLPFITAMGTGLDLNMSLEGLAKGVILGIGTASQLITAIGSLAKGGGLNLNNWTMNSNKGSGFAGYTNVNSLTETTSSTSYVTNTNSTGTSQSLVDQQKSEGESVMGKEEDDGGERMIDNTDKLVDLVTALLENSNALRNWTQDVEPYIKVPAPVYP